MGLFDKLKKGLQKTKDLLRTDVRDLFTAGESLTDAKLQDFYARLIAPDMGVASANATLEELTQKDLGRTVVIDEVWGTVRDKLKSLLKGGDDRLWDVGRPLSPLRLAPAGVTVILVAGVNGVGKTTSIAKL